MAFTHLHVHSEYSILDGLCKIDEVLERVQSIGQKSIAITDHGNMSSFPEFYTKAKKADINPIIGEEFYITPDASIKDKKKPNWHIILLAKNKAGYHTLCELSSIASKDFYYKPRIDWKILKEFMPRLDDIIALTGCLNGEIPWQIAQDNMKNADKILKLYKVIFPNLYVEFQKHGGNPEFVEREQKVAKGLLTLARKYDLPTVLTGDAHFVKEEDHKFHDMWLAIQTKDTIDNPKRFHFEGHGYHIQTEKEMSGLYPKLWPEFEKNIRKLVKGVYIDLPEMNNSSWYIPKPKIEQDPFEYVYEQSMKGLKERVPEDRKAYKKVLDYQLGIIKEANFTNEFVIVEDYVNWAKKNNIYVGSGRGSMVGVLPSYLMKISDVDPIRFKLSFERAINPARPSLPDFDIDFATEGRDKVIAYLKEKYGEDNVALIGTLERLGPRSVLGKVLKALGFSFQEQVKYTKSLPDSVAIDNNRSSDDIKQLLSDLSTEEDFVRLLEERPEIIEYCMKFSGMVYGMGTHAGGVIISDEGRPIKKLVPTIRIKNEGNDVSQYDMDDIKYFGFVKFDLLGLRTLNIIQEAISIIGHNPVQNFPDGFDMEDPKVFATINNGFLNHVFQLAGYANRMAMEQIGGVESFEDIVNIISIARPGTAQFIPEMARNKKDPSQISYPDKRLKSILGPTHGVLLLQEQVMEIGRVFAGFDNIKLDDIKETIKKKDPVKFKTMYPIFRDGCRENGMKLKTIKAVWKIIENAAGYLYNRAHAVSYASTAYLTAWFKTYYPREYYLAILRYADWKDYIEIIKEARRRGIKVTPANIFTSDVKFRITENKEIQFGFSNIKNIGEKMGAKLIALREEKGKDLTVEDIANMNVGVFKHLNAAGILEDIGGRKPTKNNEEQYYGVAISTDPLKDYRKFFKKYVFNEKNLNKMQNGGQDVVIGGLVEKINKVTTKYGQEMAFIKLSIDDRYYDLVLFPNKIYLLEGIKENKVLLAIGDRQPNYNSYVPDTIEVL